MKNESRATEKNSENSAAPSEPAERRASSLPLILTIVSLLLWFGFQTAQLLLERSNLASLKGNQEAAMQASEKMREQIETLITKTAELANQGNPGARTVVDELEKKGIPIKAAPQASK